jgi:acetyltransferase
MAFIIVTVAADHGQEETLGVMRTVTDPENIEAEFAIIVRSDVKRRGLGRMLFDKMIRYCRSRGTEKLVGDVLKENKPMLNLTRRLGFAERNSPDPAVVRVTLKL